MNDCCKESCGNPCGKPQRILSIKEVSDRPTTLCFNLDGHSILYDFDDLVKAGSSDTHLRTDSVARGLVFNAEKHIDHISARQLGNVLHLSDIGDVNTNGVTQNSLLTFQKNSECGTGCDQVSNQWVAYNASEHLTDTIETLFGFDSEEAPQTLREPEHTNQFYSLMWRGQNKLGYSQPVEVSAPSADDSGYSELLFVNPTTRQLETLKVVVSIDNQGNVGLKTQGSV